MQNCLPGCPTKGGRTPRFSTGAEGVGHEARPLSCKPVALAIETNRAGRLGFPVLSVALCKIDDAAVDGVDHQNRLLI